MPPAFPSSPDKLVAMHAHHRKMTILRRCNIGAEIPIYRIENILHADFILIFGPAFDVDGAPSYRVGVEKIEIKGYFQLIHRQRRINAGSQLSELP